METLIPSGMLCRAIAAIIESPKERSVYPAIKVTIPSGRLCRRMAAAEITPSRPSFRRSIPSPGEGAASGVRASISWAKNIPITMGMSSITAPFPGP